MNSRLISLWGISACAGWLFHGTPGAVIGLMGAMLFTLVLNPF